MKHPSSCAAHLVWALFAVSCMGAVEPPLSIERGASGSTDQTGGAGAGEAASKPKELAAGAGPFSLRRLSVREYNNTVVDLLGVSGYRGIVLPPDVSGDSVFASPGELTTQHAQAFLEAAEELADLAMKRPSGRILPCSPAAGAAAEESCAAEFIRDFGKRAFRRPLAKDEAGELLAFYRKARNETGYDFGGAVGLLLQAFLQSPRFLYHHEREGAPTYDGNLVRLGPYELASRLSYMLWETMPDPALFAAADGARLSNEKEVAAEVTRMLDNDRAARSLGSFHRQWLGMGDLAHLEKDAKTFPDFVASVRPSLEAELGAFAHFVFQGDARLETLLTAPVAFATKATAPLYGVSANVIAGLGSTAAKIDLPPTQRSGLLTQTAFLSATGSQTDSRPIKRGAAIWKRLLCLSIPPPPANLKDAIEQQVKSTATEREKAAARKARADCGACHQYLDPSGFAFEHYDAVGRFRNRVAGAPVDSAGSLALARSGTVGFADAVDLLRQLAKSEEARRCVTQQWFRYALGRAQVPEEEGAIEAAYRALAGAESFDLGALVMAVTQSRPFRFRSPSAGEMP